MNYFGWLSIVIFTCTWCSELKCYGWWFFLSSQFETFIRHFLERLNTKNETNWPAKLEETKLKLSHTSLVALGLGLSFAKMFSPQFLLPHNFVPCVKLLVLTFTFSNIFTQQQLISTVSLAIYTINLWKQNTVKNVTVE